MKITAVFVSSVDGKVTKGDDPNIYTWTSEEDGSHFFSLLKNYHLIIMGSKTYEAAKEKIKLSSSTLRVVLTNDTNKYKNQEVPGMLEFTKGSPQNLIKRLENTGYSEALFVGGSRLFHTLLKNRLIDELYLTIEPRLFGNGLTLIHGDETLDISLTLEEMKKLNDQGTLLLTYSVNK